MPLTQQQIMLMDILSDRIITLINTWHSVPTMTEEQVNVEIAKWETKSDAEMDRLNQH